MISYKSGVKSFNNLIIVIPILVYEIIAPVVSLFLLVRSFRNNQLYKRLTLSSDQNDLRYFYIDYPTRCFYWDFVRMA